MQKSIRSIMLTTMCFLFLAVLSGNAPAVEAADTILHVAPSGVDNASCGNIATPCKSIQQAVNLAPLGQLTEIRVAQGTYLGTGENVVTLQPDFPGRSVTIIGGFTTGNWTVPQTDPAKTVIDGENQRRGVLVWNNIGVDSQGNPPADQKVTLRNITIQNGLVNQKVLQAQDGQWWVPGGGLWCFNNNAKGKISVELDNVLVTKNSVSGPADNGIAMGGGAIFHGCPVMLNDVTFDGNQVIGGPAPDDTRGEQAVGGGLFAGNGSDVVGNNVIFSNNVTIGGSGGSGFRGAEAPDALGAGASFQHNTVQLSNIQVLNNVATGGNANTGAGSGSGGGFFFEVATVTITDAMFKSNKTVGGVGPTRGGFSNGAGFHAVSSVLDVQRSQFIANESIGGNSTSDGGDAGGAGIFIRHSWLQHPNNSSHLNGVNLVFAYNKTQPGSGPAFTRSGGGAAINSTNSTMDLDHITVHNNSIALESIGVALLVQHDDGWTGQSSMNLRNSILSENRFASINNPAWGIAAVTIQRAGDSTVVDRTLFFDNSSEGTGSNNEVATQDNKGGASISVTNKLAGDPAYVAPQSPDYNYALQFGSAAIDKAQTSTVNQDILGNARPGGSAADVGAYEYRLPWVNAVGRDGEIAVMWSAEWQNFSGLEGFEIVYTTVNRGADVKVVVPKDQTMYTISSLTNYQSYNITLNALDGSGAVLASSNTVTVFPTDIHIYLPGLSR